MTAQRDDRRTALAFAVMRVALLVVIVVSEQLVDRRQLEDSGFFVILGGAAVYALIALLVARRESHTQPGRAFRQAQPALDVALLSGLCYTSGGAFSDVRKAFFVIPLAASFTERPRSTASWSLLAVAVFTVVAMLAGGNPPGVINNWQRLTVSQDLYLGWTGAAGTLLAAALLRRSKHTEELAASRQRLVTHAIESVERERTRLAGALHDSPVQNLIAARHDLRRAQRSGDEESFRRLHEAIDVTIADLREEIFKLHPHVLDHVGLNAAFEQVARHHARNANLEITVAVHAHVEPALHQVLFALGRELLANAAKHANASKVALSVEAEGSSIVLEVSDDGDGIPEGRMRQALLEGHVGLAAVTERVAVLGGTLEFAGPAGGGTTIRIALPALREPLMTAGDVSDRVTSFDTPLVSPT